MKQIFLVGLIMLLISGSNQVSGQEADSLINLLNTRKNKPTEVLTLYKELCLVYSYNDSKKLSEYAYKGIELSEKQNENKFLMWFTVALAESYSSFGTYDTAMIHFNTASDLAVKTNDEAYLAWININIANTYVAMNKVETALSYYIKALSYVEENNKLQYATVLSNMGIIHRSLNNFDRAIEYLRKSDSLAVDMGIGEKMYNVHEMGVIYLKLDEYDKALEYLERALIMSREANDRSLEINTLNVLSEVYMYGFEEYDKAMELANLCLKLALEYGDQRLIPISWLALSNVYRTKKQYAECEETALKVLEMSTCSEFDIQLNTLDNILWANIFMNNKTKASEYLDKLYGFINEQMEENAQNILLDMEVKYETEKKEMHIVSLEKERQQYFWLGITGVFLALALGIVLWQKIKNARKEKQLIATRSVLDGEMGERARLARDLHDRLSGNLSAVKIGLNDHMESLQIINAKLDRCIEEIRHVAHNLMPTSLQYGLKVALEDFVVQFPNVHFHFFGKEKRIEERLEFIIYCCANELITNSVRHSGAKNINVQLVQDDKHVSLTVQDDGCGFDETSASKGFGLKSIRDRVTSCNGKIDMTLSTGKGTETTIELKTE